METTLRVFKPISFIAQDHDNLGKCKACGAKFDKSELKLIAGHYICKYCIKDWGKHVQNN